MGHYLLLTPRSLYTYPFLLFPSVMALLVPFSSSSASSSSSFCSAPARRLPSPAVLFAADNRCPVPFNYIQTASCSALKAIRSSARSVPSVKSLKMPIDLATSRCSPCSTLSSKSVGAPVADCEGTVQEVVRKNPVVSVHWLREHLHDPSLKVLDASWYMPAEKRSPLQEFKELHIPGSSFFDIEAISDVTSDLPHMLPSEAAFSAAVSALGIKNDDAVIIYDGSGIFSAARVWWMFRVFGHRSVSVLDGGLPHWRQFGYPLDSAKSQVELDKIKAAALAVEKFYEGEQVSIGDFKATLQRDLVWTSKEVMKNLEDKKFQHIDARSKARFDGIAPEPRQGVRSGHVPGSKCIPFGEVLNGQCLLRDSEDLVAKFRDAEISLDSPIVASCGTGVTACILALALDRLGRHDVPVYDGSWTEWGALLDAPVETSNAVNSS